MHRWPMKINKLNHDLNNYSKIVIVSPIWVFHMCSPIRELLIENNELLRSREVEIHLIHFNSCLPNCAEKEIIEIFPATKIYSYSSHYGKIK